MYRGSRSRMVTCLVVWLSGCLALAAYGTARSGLFSHSHFLPAILKAWPPPTPTPPPGRLLITEVLYNPPGDEPEGEWIEIANIGAAPVSLADYKLGDAARPGSGESMYTFPAGARLPPGQVVVIACRAATFRGLYGRPPDYELNESDPYIPTLAKFSLWSAGTFGLSNAGDEVILLDVLNQQADMLSWGNSGSGLLPPVEGVADGHSLERRPANLDSDTAADWIDQREPNPGKIDLTPIAPTSTATSTEGSPGSTPTASFTPGPDIPLNLLLSEVLYDPAGSGDPEGEWVEIYNLSGSPANLSGCKLGDEETPGEGEGMLSFPDGSGLAPGQTLIVANQASEFRSVFGFSPAFELVESDSAVPNLLKYSAWASGSMNLSNTGDEVLLLDALDEPIDVLSWGEASGGFQPAAPDVPEGHSLERVPAGQDTNSAADWSDQPSPAPGKVELSPPAASATPTRTLTATRTPTTTGATTAARTKTPTATRTPTRTATPTRTSTPTPTSDHLSTSTVSPTPTGTRVPASHLLISEVLYEPEITDLQPEWIELYNPASAAIDLSGYKIGDEETQGGGEGMYRFPAGAILPPRAARVAAVKASEFYLQYGYEPEWEFIESDPSVPNLQSYSAWASGSLRLHDFGDEVLLLGPDDQAVDVVVYGEGLYPGVNPHTGVPPGYSLERRPADQDTDDCRLDFIAQVHPDPGSISTTPGGVGGLPAPVAWLLELARMLAGWILNSLTAWPPSLAARL